MISLLSCWFLGKHKENAIYDENDVYNDPNGKYLYTTYTLKKVCKVCNKELGISSGSKNKNL